MLTTTEEDLNIMIEVFKRTFGISVTGDQVKMVITSMVSNLREPDYLVIDKQASVDKIMDIIIKGD